MLFNDRAAPCGFQSSVSSAESASKTDCGCRMQAGHRHDNLQNIDEWPKAAAEQCGMLLNHLERISSA